MMITRGDEEISDKSRREKLYSPSDEIGIPGNIIAHSLGRERERERL
jgi:hypothetical protein